MRDNIQHYGCYYYSLVWWAHWLTNINVSADMLNNGLYVLFQKRGWMSDTCFINNPVAMLDWMGVPAKTITKEGPSFVPRKTDIVIGQWKHSSDMSHFVAMNPNGCVAYDPWFSPEGGSKAVREGKLISYRIIRR